MLQEEINQLISYSSSRPEALTLLKEVIGDDQLSSKQLAKAYMEVPGSRESVIKSAAVSPETVVLFLLQATGVATLRSFLSGRSALAKDLLWTTSVLSQYPGREELQREVSSMIDVSELTTDVLSKRAPNVHILRGLSENPTSSAGLLVFLLNAALNTHFPPETEVALNVIKHRNFQRGEAAYAMDKFSMSMAPGGELMEALSEKLC